MILPLSGSRLPALALLLLLVLIPTVVHSYRSFEIEAAPLGAEHLPAQVDGRAGVDVPRSDQWMRETYGAESWVERRYGTGGDALTLFVVRGHDLKKIYHHPELGVLRGRSFERARVVPLAVDDARPVHVLQPVTATGDSAVYALVYDDEWVGNPYWLQLRSAVSSLWAGKRPITLAMAYGAGVLHVDGTPIDRASAALVDVVGAAAGSSSTP